MVSGSTKQPLGIRGKTALREVTPKMQSLHRWENGDVSKEGNSDRLFFQNKKKKGGGKGDESRTFSWVIILSVREKPALWEPWVTQEDESTEDKNDVNC